MKNFVRKEKLRIAVLMGGTSSEREISLLSGAAITEGLQKSGHKITPVILNEDKIKKSDLEDIDCAFIALHGGFGENGDLQQQLEAWGIPFTGPGPEACRVCMNKKTAKMCLKEAGLNTPNFYIVRKESLDDSTKNVIFPVAIKPTSEGSSIGLVRVDEREGLLPAFEEAWKFGPEALVEEWIEGKELTVSILKDSALPIIEIIPKEKFYNYRAKYDSCGTQYVVPAELTDKLSQRIKEEALRAFKITGCRGYSRVDMMLGKDGIAYILEINTVPGFTKNSLLPRAAQAAGISFGELCARIVMLALESHKDKISRGGFYPPLLTIGYFFITMYRYIVMF